MRSWLCKESPKNIGFMLKIRGRKEQWWKRQETFFEIKRPLCHTSSWSPVQLSSLPPSFFQGWSLGDWLLESSPSALRVDWIEICPCGLCPFGDWGPAASSRTGETSAPAELLLFLINQGILSLLLISYLCYLFSHLLQINHWPASLQFSGSTGAGTGKYLFFCLQSFLVLGSSSGSHQVAKVLLQLTSCPSNDIQGWFS